MNEELTIPTRALTRRALVGAAAWAAPVVAVSVATPAVAASTPTGTAVLTFSKPLSAMEVCDTLTAGELVAMDTSGNPVGGATVSVTLPAYLAWNDGSTGTKILTTDVAGAISLVGLVRGTGRAGTFPVTATGLSVTTNEASANAVLAASAGTIFYSSDQKTAIDSDPSGLAADARDFIITTNYVYAITSTGDWYVKAHANATEPYQKINGVPPVDSIWGGDGSDYGYAIAGGTVYRSPATTAAVEVTGASDVVALAPTGSRLLAMTAGGELYRATTTSAFTRVVLATDTATPLTNVTAIDGNEGGGYGWVISGTDIYYINTGSTDNLARLSTTIATAKPANPVALGIGSTYAYALDADGSVWVHYTASAGAWTQMPGLPGEPSLIMSNQGGNNLWALVDGTVYCSSDQKTFVAAGMGPGLVGTAKQLWAGANYSYIVTESGEWWQRKGASSTDNWAQITGTPGDKVISIATNYGDYAWAIAERNAVCAV